MIDQQTIAKIMDAAQIVDVVSDFVTLKKRGVNYLGLCPFHNEKTPSFTVSPAKGIFKCFGCGKGGNSVHFIMEHEQLSYADALRFLAKKYHIEIIEKEQTDEEKLAQSERESLFAVNDYAVKYFIDNLNDTRDGQAIGLSYFRERGFKDEIIKKFQLGYSLNEFSAFSDKAIKNGYNAELLEKLGLSIRRENDNSLFDRFRGRVMFPVHSISGKVVAFGGRILKKDEKTAKYLNSPESSIYHKSNELYGLYFAKQFIVKHDRCILVEGYADVISMHQAGIENVVASSGTSLTLPQIRLIRRFTPNITVIYDGDAAGIKASIRGIDLLLEEGMNIKVLLLPDGQDPDNYAQTHNASDFIEFIKTHQVDFIHFKTNLLLEEAGKDPIKKAELIGDLVKSMSLISDSIIRSVYVKECADLLEVDEKILHNAINKLRRKYREDKQKADFVTTNNAAEKTEVEIKVDLPRTTVMPYDAEEKNILYFLVRYAGEVLYEKTENEITVAKYIVEELDCDHIIFQNPLHALMLEEMRKHIDDKSFNSSVFYTNYPNCDVSSLAADLMTDKYMESKIFLKHISDEKKRELYKQQEFEEWLSRSVPRVILEMKNKLVLEQLKEARERLKSNFTPEAMKKYAQLDALKNEISNAKELGERVVIK
ncbi:MAG: DNA primase [Sphingobacteriia bacterium]|jgi:DNA primase|nr:DNA primase [Paludibacteraceae bacterium]NCA79609.1 DNA primase [Sphingobacteriia bacterium]